MERAVCRFAGREYVMKLSFDGDKVKDFFLEVVRFWQSLFGALVMFGLAGVAIGLVLWFGAPGYWVFVIFDGVIVMSIILACPGLNVPENQYKSWLFSKIKERNDDSVKKYRSWRDVPSPSAGYASKLRNRWYERIFGE
jgi:hypothetical protein